MDDDRDRLDGGDDSETGEPIEALADLDVETSPRFLARVRGRIDRRLLTSQALSVLWYLPAALFMELLSIVFELIGSPGDRKGGSS